MESISLRASTEDFSRVLANEFEDSEIVVLPSPTPIRLGDFFTALKNHQQRQSTPMMMEEQILSSNEHSEDEAFSTTKSEQTTTAINPEGM